MHCLDCAYELRGTEERRCPECGRGFDPRDRSTWGDRWSARRARICIWLGRATIIELLLICVFGLYEITLGMQLFGVMLTAIVFGGPILVVTAGSWIICATTTPHTSIRRSAWTCVALVLLFISLATRWPFHVAFWLSRPALDQIAHRCEAGHPPAMPTRAGVFRISDFDERKGHWVFWLTDADGVLVYQTAANHPDLDMNVWSEQRVNDEWIMVNLD